MGEIYPRPVALPMPNREVVVRYTIDISLFDCMILAPNKSYLSGLENKASLPLSLHDA